MEDIYRTIPGQQGNQDPNAIHKGTEIMGRYSVIEQLGRGGMGVVYRCYDKIGGIEIALKSLPPEVSHNDNAMANIRDNFILVENLNHPNIANIKQLERNPQTGDYYLIMEYVQGEDLAQWIRKYRNTTIPMEQLLKIVKETASALDYAHKQRVIHRDIKPANIMRCPPKPGQLE